MLYVLSENVHFVILTAYWTRQQVLQWAARFLIILNIMTCYIFRMNYFTKLKFELHLVTVLFKLNRQWFNNKQVLLSPYWFTDHNKEIKQAMLA